MRTLLDGLDEPLRVRALTHPAWADDRLQSFERLEFLGDAVLGLAISDEVCRRFPELSEGDLSRIKAAAVSRTACAEVARAAELGDAMSAAAPDGSDPATVAQMAGLERVLAALTESVIGAAFGAHGYDVVAPVVLAAFEAQIEYAVANRVDAKSELQEHVQQLAGSVAYEVIATDGPDHERSFTIRARVEAADRRYEAEGAGSSKKAAEQQAARAVLDQLGR